MMAGMGLQAKGAYDNSKAAKASYETQAAVSQNNAQIRDWEAADALLRGDHAATGVRRAGNQLKGKQRAAMAANGVDLGVGSALQILSDTDYFTGVDAATTLDNAAKEAWAIRQQANNFENDAQLQSARARAERPGMAAATSLLTSAGRVAGNWYRPGLRTPEPRRRSFDGEEY